jgi:hypothetical protein
LIYGWRNSVCKRDAAFTENREPAGMPGHHRRYLIELARIRRRKVHQNGAYPIDFSLRR